MRTIKIDLPQDISQLEIHTFADEHFGDEHCDIKRLLARIEYVKNNPNAYCILNGDIIDNATKTSIGDTYTQVFNPMEQLKYATEMFEPIRDKILCITHGNHENRTYKKEGINLSCLMANQLGLADKYTPTSAVLFIRFGKVASNRKETNGSGNVRKVCYTLYVLHGSGGGRKEGAKAIRLADMASIIDTDIYIHSHTHLPMIMKQGFHRIDVRNNDVAKYGHTYHILGWTNQRFQSETVKKGEIRMIKDFIIAFLVLCCIGLTAAWLISYVKDEQQNNFKE